MKILTQADLAPEQADSADVLTLPPDTDVLALALEGWTCIELQFPTFTDGRAYSQAQRLRQRGYRGRLRATGAVLLDQLLPMQRCGFDEALLRADQDASHAQRLLQQFGAFYQGDAQQALPRYARPQAAATASAHYPRTGSALEQAHPSADFNSKLALSRALLERAAREFQPVVQASSLGAEDVVITHLIETLGLDIGILVLDTGALHPETLALLARTQQRLPRLRVWHPEAAAVADFVAAHGSDAMFRSRALRQQCCALRKLEPLRHALAGHKAWVCGLRREQSGARAEVPLIDRSALAPGANAHPSAGLVQFNPLADWTWGDVWHCIRLHELDYNPLHDHFYPSIGCAPCTRAVALGEDARAGRWWWEQDGTRECGLHRHASSGAKSAGTAQQPRAIPVMQVAWPAPEPQHAAASTKATP